MRQASSTITSKGQVTIPKSIRDQLGVGPSDRVTFVVLDSGRVEVRPARYTIESLRGIVPTPPGLHTEDFDELFDQAFQERADQLSGRKPE
jgi:AbrB family looped-hinge helix DNA binding protein